MWNGHPADTIYFHGVILPMTGEHDRAEAVAVKNGRILDVGDSTRILAHQGPETKMVDLHGKTLLPGFYDGHSHFSTVGLTQRDYVDLNSRPIGSMTCIDDYIQALRQRRTQLGDDKPVLGTGYDQTTIRDQRHPTRWDLDQVSTTQPVILNHVTAHIMTVNSKALEMMGIDRETPDPAGGRIIRDETGLPTGVLEENAVFYVWNHPGFQIFGTEEDKLEHIRWASQVYARAGITTANEGSVADYSLFEKALAQGKLGIRVSLWMAPDKLLQTTYSSQSDYITIGGGKTFQDGSLTCYTAYLSQPYLTLPGQKPTQGYPAGSREKLKQTALALTQAGYNFYVHCNGDAAIQDVLDAFAYARSQCPQRKNRLVCIHAQTARPDQLQRMKELDAEASFYCSSVYYNGDRFANLFLGEERAMRCNPIASAFRLGLHPTMHTDAPVQPQNPLFSIWAAVNRLTADGVVLGSQEQITPYQALLANTLYPAYQNGEEGVKGSLEAGKYADFVILDRNPLQTPPMELKEIRVCATIVGDRVIYELEGEQ